jgi:uncharacterized membrane protein YhhN
MRFLIRNRNFQYPIIPRQLCMEAFLKKRVLIIYWVVLLVHCMFQYFVSPYRAITKPLLVPLLITYVLLHDENIGKPLGKSMFYIGLFLGFFGDVLLIFINDTFFLSGMIAFMLMNIFYCISFLALNRLRIGKLLFFAASMVILLVIGLGLYQHLENGMGIYKIPVMFYLFTISIMVSCAVNVLANGRYKKAALQYLIPGALIFMIENILVAFNKFQWDGNKDVYIAVMFTYGCSQYLMVKGVLKTYLWQERNEY